jgi:hypothetical protein
MALFHITIEKVIVKDNEEANRLLCAINKKLDLLIASSPEDEKTKQEIMDMLNSALADIKSTV